jgi:hypothetical protein
MKKSELRELVREIVGGYEPDGQGNLVRHSDKFDSTKLSDILMKVAKGPVSEEATDIKNVEISYVYPGGRFYGVRADGVKLPGFDASKEFIKDLTGLELPTRAYFDDKEILDIVDALKAKGIQATSSEMDVS